MVRIIKMSFLKKLAADIGIFAVLSIVITLLSFILPYSCFHYENWMFKQRKWEKNGKFYQNIFKVKLWKDKLPELADFIKFAFPKKFIKEFKGEFLSKYIKESCRAELVHWIIIYSSIIFLFFNDISTFIIMVIIDVMLNIPFIIIQRYNRPRIISIMKHKGMAVQL